MKAVGRDSKVRIAFFGVGRVGTAALELSRSRPWIEVAGAVRRPRTGVGAGLPLPAAWEGVRLWERPDAMLERGRPEVALIATRSPLEEVLPDVEMCVRRGVHVISTSEELAWAEVEKPEAAAMLEHAAKEAGVVVSAVGINPGLVFDALPLVLAGAAWDVERIVARRTLDASVFGRGVHRSLGIGYTEAGFRRAVEERRVRGHIGFAESARAVAHAMGLEIEQYDEQIEPVLAEQEHELADYTIRPPETAGATQLVTASAGGRDWLRFELSLHVDPGAVGWETLDRIRISGRNEIDLVIRPGLSAVLTTGALLVNTIPAVLAAPPGYYRAASLLPTPPWLAARPPPAAPFG